MRIRVTFSDGATEIFEDATLDEAAEKITDVVIGTDFTTLVSNVEEIDEQGNKVQALYPNWTMKLTTG